MPGLEISIAFFFTALLLGISPGPDIIFVLTQSALYGVRAGLVTTLGLCTGLCLQTLAVALGLAALLHTFPLAFNLLRYCGAAYLLWLAWLALRAKPDKVGINNKNASGSHTQYYTRGVIMNVTNPKFTIFFLAFLPQFCNPGRGGMTLQICYFGLLFIIATLMVFSAAAWLGGSLAKWFNNSPSAQLWLNRGAAAVFISLALMLVLIEN